MNSNGHEDVKAAIDDAETVEPPPIDLGNAGFAQRDALLQVCDAADVWRSPEGEAFASVHVEQHVEHMAVGSKAFQNWMVHGLATRYVLKGRPASANQTAISDARLAIEARALVSGKVFVPALRITEHGGAIYIDLGTSDWSAIKVDAEGWSVVPVAPVPILRSKRAAPFTNPIAAADFKPLRRLLSHLDENTFILLVAWCVVALLPNGPYPPLALSGEQGAGKSTLARLVQRIVDPVHGDLLQPPNTGRDLIAYAKGNRVLSFDNLSGLSAELADSFCRLSTGSEIGGRALFSDYEVATFAACRPLVFNGIPDLAARADLADRTIVVRLPPLSVRMTEREWRAAVEQVLPACFAALLDALSCGLERLDATPTPNVRMADFARFVVAAEPALPWPPGAFLRALDWARMNTAASLAEGDAVVVAIRKFMEPQSEWSGLISELHNALSAQIPERPHRSRDWPANARWLGDRLRRAIPTLRAIGIVVEERRISTEPT